MRGSGGYTAQQIQHQAGQAEPLPDGYAERVLDAYEPPRQRVRGVPSRVAQMLCYEVPEPQRTDELWWRSLGSLARIEAAETRVVVRPRRKPRLLWGGEGEEAEKKTAVPYLAGLEWSLAPLRRLP